MNSHTLSDFIAQLESGNGWLPFAMAGLVWTILSLLAMAVNRWGLPRLKLLTKLSKTNIDDLLVEGIASHLPAFLYLGAFVLAFGPLHLSPGVGKAFRFVIAFWFLMATVQLAHGVLRFFIFRIWLPRYGDEELNRKVHSLSPFISVALWLGGALLLLDNFGFKISAIVTGLGIGGVAVALASQAVLGDLFSYISILFDKPFEKGDTITVGDLTGTVEEIGIKTTRLRSVTGEQLIFSNTDLTGSRVRNFKRMQERRVLFRVGVTYDTPTAVLQQLPGQLRALVESVPQTRFDRAHFVAFGPSSLDFEIVFFVLSANYNVCMDVQQAIHLAIKTQFDSLGIAFAFPTQTVYLAGASAQRA